VLYFQLSILLWENWVPLLVGKHYSNLSKLNFPLFLYNGFKQRWRAESWFIWQFSEECLCFVWKIVPHHLTMDPKCSLYSCNLCLLMSLSFWIGLSNMLSELVLSLLQTCIVKIPCAACNLAYTCDLPPPISSSFWVGFSNSSTLCWSGKIYA